MPNVARQSVTDSAWGSGTRNFFTELGVFIAAAAVTGVVFVAGAGIYSYLVPVDQSAPTPPAVEPRLVPKPPTSAPPSKLPLTPAADEGSAYAVSKGELASPERVLGLAESLDGVTSPVGVQFLAALRVMAAPTSQTLVVQSRQVTFTLAFSLIAATKCEGFELEEGRFDQALELTDLSPKTVAAGLANWKTDPERVLGDAYSSFLAFATTEQQAFCTVAEKVKSAVGNNGFWK